MEERGGFSEPGGGGVCVGGLNLKTIAMEMFTKLGSEDSTPPAAPSSEGHDSMDSGVGCHYEKPLALEASVQLNALRLITTTGDVQESKVPPVKVHHPGMSLANSIHSHSKREGLSTPGNDLQKADEFCTVSSVGYRCVSYQKQMGRGRRANSVSSNIEVSNLGDQRYTDSPTSLASFDSVPSYDNENGNRDDPRGPSSGKNENTHLHEVIKNGNNGGTKANSYSSGSDTSVCRESPPLEKMAVGSCSLSPKHKRALYHKKHYPPGLAKITALDPSGQYSREEDTGGNGSHQILHNSAAASLPRNAQQDISNGNHCTSTGLGVTGFDASTDRGQSSQTNTINDARPFHHNGYDHSPDSHQPKSRVSPTPTAATTSTLRACSDSSIDSSSVPPAPLHAPVNRVSSGNVVGASNIGTTQGQFLAPDKACHGSSNGRHNYSRLPVVRVDLAEDQEDPEGQQYGSEDDLSARPMATGNRKTSSRRVQELEEEETHMEDQIGGTGGLQAIDLEELQRRRRTRANKKKKFVKNILILSFAFVSLFSATSGLIILQSSLNRRMGVFGLCANFVAVAISCLLLPKALIQLLGCKWTIVASMGCFMLWIMSNLHPTWATLIPSAVVMGIGWAPLWTAQCTYFTVTGIEYAKWADNMPDVVIARMFGIFFMIFMTASIWGNLLSSSVLSNGHFNDRTRPLPLPGDPESIYRFCGAADCPGIYDNITNENYNRPENSLVYTLVGLYLGLSLIGLTLVAFFLDRLELERDADRPRCTAVSFTASLKQITNPYQIFIIPLTVYTGMEQVFLTVEYTRAYATCALGMEKIGYVVISYATVAALISLASSQLVNVVGRMPLFLLGAGAHIGCMVVFMRWTPYPDSLIMFIIMPAIWGIGDAIWQSQINAFYGVLFSDQSEAAFANYRMWESVGFIMSLSYSPFLCVYSKIYILIGCLITGLLGYFVVEGLYSKASSERETELAKKGIPVDPDTTDSDGAPFSGLAQMIRRKSSVYLPQSAVREAAEVMRRKSNAFLTPGIDNPERVIRRRLSTFAPVMEVNEDNSAASSICSTPVVQQRSSSLGMSDDVFERDKLDDDVFSAKSDGLTLNVVGRGPLHKREYQV